MSEFKVGDRVQIKLGSPNEYLMGEILGMYGEILTVRLPNGDIFNCWYDEITSASDVTEQRATDPNTGGKKGRKPEEYALIPVGPLAEVARVYGMGANKYEPRNWEKSYPFSWSYSSLQRHANAFWDGQTNDPESGLNHLAHVVFHCFAMMEWLKTHPEQDDRPKRER